MLSSTLISVKGTVAHEVAFSTLNGVKRRVAPRRALRALITLHWDREEWEAVRKILHTIKTHPFLPRKGQSTNTGLEPGAGPLTGHWDVVQGDILGEPLIPAVCAAALPDQTFSRPTAAVFPQMTKTLNMHSRCETH